MCKFPIKIIGESYMIKELALNNNFIYLKFRFFSAHFDILKSTSP